jgi:hypothetical protein
VTGKLRQLGEPPDPKKPTVLRGSAGVWNCESSGHIEGRDGACLHALEIAENEGMATSTGRSDFSFRSVTWRVRIASAFVRVKEKLWMGPVALAEVRMGLVRSKTARGR